MSIKVNCKTTIHYFRYEGNVTIVELKKVLHEAHTNQPANRLLHDLRKADISHFTNRDLQELGMYFDGLIHDAKRRRYKSAIIVPDKLTYGLIRCAMAQSDIAENSTRIYYDIDFAIDWLVGLRK